jgi:Protein of unknown function (DUF3800)
MLDFDQIKSLPASALDLALTIALDTISYWKASEGSFELIHDAASNMARRKEMWDFVTSPAQQEALLGFGDYRQWRLPLNVTSTIFADSKQYAGLQIADVLAGAAYEVARARAGYGSHDANYVNCLVTAGIDKFGINRLWPLPDVKPTEPVIGAPAMSDPLTYMGRLLNGRI